MTHDYTKGPWKIESDAGIWGRDALIMSEDDMIVAEIAGRKGLMHIDIMPDARLILAAPELAESCEALVEWDSRPEEEQTDERLLAIIEAARAALRKAGVLE